MIMLLLSLVDGLKDIKGLIINHPACLPVVELGQAELLH